MLACAELELKHAELVVLASYWTYELLNMQPQPSYSTIAEHWRLSERVVRRAVAKLCEIGLLIRPEGWKTGKRNAYAIDRALLDYYANRGDSETTKEEERKKAAISATRRDAVNVRWDKTREKAQAGTSLTPEEFDAMLEHYHDQDPE